MIKTFFSAVVLLGAVACSEPGPYSATADPYKDFANALERARSDGKFVLLVFGANWCPDCRSLDKKFQQTPLADTVAAHFHTVYVDVGDFDRNLEFTGVFGQPTKGGIPSIAIVGPDQQLRYVAEAGEFASARHAEMASLNAWFEQKIAEIRRSSQPLTD